MPAKPTSPKAEFDDVFGQARTRPKIFRVGLYVPVSTEDQQTSLMQNRAMREYAARRGWTIALQVREVGSGPEAAARANTGGRLAPRDCPSSDARPTAGQLLRRDFTPLTSGDYTALAAASQKSHVGWRSEDIGAAHPDGSISKGANVATR